MDWCNDPRCGLNRHGVAHRAHELIEQKPLTNPCNDPKCALNREGVRHNADEHAHAGDGAGAGRPRAEETAAQDGPRTKRKARPFDWLADDPEDRSARRTYTDMYGGTRTPVDDALDELSRRASRERGHGGARSRKNAESAGTGGAGRPSSGSAKSRIDPTAEVSDDAARILGSDDPYKVLGLRPGAGLDEIRSNYKDLVKKYDPSRGIIGKPVEQKRMEEQIMARVHRAYGQLKRRST